jgi:hypothetical protein
MLLQVGNVPAIGRVPHEERLDAQQCLFLGSSSTSAEMVFKVLKLRSGLTRFSHITGRPSGLRSPGSAVKPGLLSQRRRHTRAHPHPAGGHPVRAEVTGPIRPRDSNP